MINYLARVYQCLVPDPIEADLTGLLGSLLGKKRKGWVTFP